MHLAGQKVLPFGVLLQILLGKGRGEGGLQVAALQMGQEGFHHGAVHALSAKGRKGHGLTDVDQTGPDPGEGDIAHGHPIRTDGGYAFFFKI